MRPPLAVLIPLWIACVWALASGCGGRAIFSDAGGASAAAAGTSSNVGHAGAGGAPAPTSKPPVAAGGGGASGIATGTAGSSAVGVATDPGAGALCSQLRTQAGVSPTKAGACTPIDPQVCYKTCGPKSTGFRSETCIAGAYVEQASCSFPSGGDFSCYKIPTVLDSSCPAQPPQAGTPCFIPDCIPCADSAGIYLDSTGAQKVGFCVCPVPDDVGTSKWSCASGSSWPCPKGNGC